MEERLGFRTDDGVGLAKELAELEKRRSKVEALQAELDEGAEGRRQGRQGTRLATRQAGRWATKQPGRQATTQAYR